MAAKCELLSFAVSTVALIWSLYICNVIRC